MTPNPMNLIWIDLEMTGLNPSSDTIIEIATMVTDSELNILAEGPVMAIHQPADKLNSMDEWNTKQHHASGLVDRVKQSTIDMREAEERTIRFLEKWVPPGCSPICGNTIGQDRRFLANYMPRLEQYFHYRYLDVSTLKILAERWAPELSSGFTKHSRHLALEDIKDSIAELKYYRRHFINKIPAK